jgi:hypothetical protein
MLRTSAVRERQFPGVFRGRSKIAQNPSTRSDEQIAGMHGLLIRAAIMGDSVSILNS